MDMYCCLSNYLVCTYKIKVLNVMGYNCTLFKTPTDVSLFSVKKKTNVSKLQINYLSFYLLSYLSIYIVSVYSSLYTYTDRIYCKPLCVCPPIHTYVCRPFSLYLSPLLSLHSPVLNQKDKTTRRS